MTLSFTKPPFFIVGCPRSGTTLLQVLLDQHPDIAIPPESFFFERFAPVLSAYGNLTEPAERLRLAHDVLRDERIIDWHLDLDAAALCERADGPGARGLIEALFQAYAEQHGKQRWGDKTPQHALCIPHIRALFPEAQIIHLLRDGRDVAESMMRITIGPGTVTGVARRWDRMVREVDRQRATLPAAQYLEVRFEDMIRDPDATRGRVFTFLGESPDVCDPLAGAIPETASRRQALAAVDHHDALAHGFRNNKIGVFRHRFSAREIGWFESIAGDTLRTHGYPLLTDGQQKPSMLRLLGFALQDGTLRYLRKLRQPRALSQIDKEIRLAAQQRLRRWRAGM